MTGTKDPGQPADIDWARSHERAYYKCGSLFIKRCLLPHGRKIQANGQPWTPNYEKARLANEAQCLAHIRQHTNIPVPKVYAAFENNGCFFLVTEWVDGKRMTELPDSQKELVKHDLLNYIAELHSLRSTRLGSTVGVIPPYRVIRSMGEVNWNLRPSNNREYVFCHNDLGGQNVLVDPKTQTIKAIIDWEYAGYFPAEFEGAFYDRIGPSVAINGERDDVSELVAFLQSRQIE